MSKKKVRKSVDELIGECFLFLGETQMLGKFLKDAASLFELYHYEDDNDWVHAEVGGDQENVDNIRIVRTVYLMSKIASFHAGKLCSLSCTFPDLWKKIEKAAEDGRDNVPENKESTHEEYQECKRAIS